MSSSSGLYGWIVERSRTHWEEMKMEKPGTVEPYRASLFGGCPLPMLAAPVILSGGLSREGRPG